MKRTIAIVLALVLMLAMFAGCKPVADRNVTLGEMTVKMPKEYELDKGQSDDIVRIYQSGGYTKCIMLSKNEAVYTAQDYITAMLDAGSQSDIGKLGDMECVYSTYKVDERPCEEVLFFYNGSAYSLALRSGDEGEFETLINSIKLK